MSLSYREQLLSPFWQRRRLEVLEAAGWECSNCGASDATLHVHHRQYFKGRQVWEYSDIELAVLCDQCHEDEHANLDALKRLVSILPARELVALVAGFRAADDWIEPSAITAGRRADSLTFAAGYVAHIVSGLDVDQMLRVAAYAAGLMAQHAEYRLHFEHSRGNIFGEESGA